MAQAAVARARTFHSLMRGSDLMADPINRVVLAYSGGLDTSVILKWLQQTYSCEVVTFTADLGQGRNSARRGTRPN
jgi:PP-loop superfamily ATP-utilizing enzyme